MKVQTDAHLQKSLPGKGIPLKTSQAFLKIFWNDIQSFYLQELTFPVSDIF